MSFPAAFNFHPNVSSAQKAQNNQFYFPPDSKHRGKFKGSGKKDTNLKPHKLKFNKDENCKGQKLPINPSNNFPKIKPHQEYEILDFIGSQQ